MMLFLYELLGGRRITAKPSEFLVHIREGKLIERACRQGGSCMVWPGDSYAIIPTTLRSVRFEVTQVSLENAEVKVVGIAVYRIASPTVAYSMLDFTDPDGCTGRIDRMLTDMCVAAVRRLVANMGIEECLRKRKESIADELRNEIVPVVSGHGSLADAAESGWGIVIDAIDIHDVNVGSDEIFGHLQAPFRNELRTSDSLSRLSMESRVDVERRRNEAERLHAQLRQEEEMARLRLEQKKKLLAMEREAELEDLRTGRELAHLQVEQQIEQAQDEQRAREAIARSELEAAERLAQLESRRARARHEAELADIREEAAREHARLETGRDAAELMRQSEVLRQAARAAVLQVDLDAERARKEIANLISDEALRSQLYAQALPEIARALAVHLERLQLTSVTTPSDGLNGLLTLAATVKQALEKKP